MQRVEVLSRHLAPRPLLPSSASIRCRNAGLRVHAVPSVAWHQVQPICTAPLTRQPCAARTTGAGSRSRQKCASVSANMQSMPAPRAFQPTSTGFQLYKITGDGSCMFRAIVQGVQFATRGKAMSLESETKAAHNLRQAVVQELRNRKEEMAPFVAGITDDWEGYLTRMAHSSAWGGEPEMVMAINIIKRPITVYRTTAGRAEAIVTYGEELSAGGTVPAVHLLWSGAHYDLLLPAAAASSSSSSSNSSSSTP